MGNQLMCIAPSQISPVEYYLTDIPDITFDLNLGSTRFLKVARAKSYEGLIVIKVFAIHDPTLPLATYKAKVEDINKKLSTTANCLSFKKTIITDKAGLLLRQFVKYSLYDRISTRPFLSTTEKKWIAFQLLYALLQCHKLGVCHGDIKLENILITSWNWLLLTDFASYKPTYLPEDNPADFSYFFDTSRRRTCYIAPERFIKTLSETSSLLTDTNLKRGELLPAMDIFSAGCALTELFSEGHPPFDLTQLLSYRNGEYNLSSVLDKIDDEEIRGLLINMMAQNPHERLSAEIILSQQRGKIFPEYFYSFLQSYMLLFSSSPTLSPEEKISKLTKDIPEVIEILTKEPISCEGLFMITSLVTSCIRGLKFLDSKLKCLSILVELAVHTSAETILDRILPYIFYYVNDPEPRIKIKAIHSLTACLSAVKNVPLSDANIFPEYVLPNLTKILSDENTLVREAYAQNISKLAQIALRFLEYSQVEYSGSQNYTNSTYESELNTLTEMIQHTVESLLKDPSNQVRQALLVNGITKLCVFFGKKRAHDLLLSHIVTFLNDNKDKHLRAAFFESIVGVASYVGCHATTALLPLLQQGICDPEEYVTAKSINAVCCITELGLINKLSLYEILHDMTCFLLHPNLWIRQAVVAFICCMAKAVDGIDLQSRLFHVIKPYLRMNIIQLDSHIQILHALSPPIPRIIYDGIVKSSEFDLFLKTIKGRAEDRRRTLEGHLPTTLVPPTIKLVYHRLEEEGMDEKMENQLIIMTEHLEKIHRRSMCYSVVKANAQSNEGRLILDKRVIKQSTHLNLNETPAPPTRARVKKTFRLFESHPPFMNAEWHHMFGNVDHIQLLNKTSTNISIITSTISETSSTVTDTHHSLVDVESISQDKSYIEYRAAKCRIDVRDLIAKKQVEYSEARRGLVDWDCDTNYSWDTGRFTPLGWKLQGILVAHLHEHQDSVNRIVTISETPIFTTCSNDGTIKLWDCQKMEGKNIVNRSFATYTHKNNSPILGMTACHNQYAVAAISYSGHVFVVRFDHGKPIVTNIRTLDLQEEGGAVDVNYISTGSSPVVVYATSFGSICAWDLRSPCLAWKLHNDLKHGVITSFCLDSHFNWLALGTSSGSHICWDLRFQLPVTTVVHPNHARVRKIIKHATIPSCILSSVQGNNEISVWNFENGFRQTVLWASPAPPLTTQSVPYSVHAMYTGMADRGNSFLLTGGSDMRIRLWNLGSPLDSRIVVPGANEIIPPESVMYKSRLIDGTDVISEIAMKITRRRDPRNASLTSIDSSDSPRPGPELPSPGHHDWINDITLVQSAQCFMLSASKDGVVKMWK